MSKKTNFMSAAALASLIALGGCAATDQQGETRADGQGGQPLTVTQQQDGRSVTIERTPGAEGGLAIPAQTVTPTVKPDDARGKKPNDKPKDASEALKVEPQAGTDRTVISREPGAAGGLRIPAQVIVPEVKIKKDDPEPPPAGPEL
ncbi:MAG: hypothetical protein KJ017_04880 [Alphaproteobacteria bacterium]|nr:hypothetical protein [Alphaproteobacteria bacterium]